MKTYKGNMRLIIISAGVILLAISLLFSVMIKKEERVKVIFIPKVYDKTNDFWMTMISGAKSAAKEYGADMTILAPTEEDDYELQEKYIEEAINLKPDVIALAPIHYSDMTDTIEKIKEAHITLILIDSKIDKDLQACYIGTNNIEAGIQMGKKMKEYIKSDTKIAIMSYVQGASTAIEREKGVRQGLGEDEARIEKLLYCQSDYEQAYEKTKKLLQEEPDINLIAGLNLYATVGVARAIKDMHMNGKVNVVGFDNDIEGIQYVEDGIIDTLIVQKPFNMGYLGIQKAVEAAHNKKIEKNIYSETEVITAGNIYSDENQKLLFPF